jgi:general stress protein YciG
MSFKNDPQRASEAGKKGGEHSHGGSHEQHVKAGQQSHKNK